MELDIIGGNYQHRFQNINPQKTINWYVVSKTNIEGNKTLHSLFPTPGLTRKFTITGNRVRGIYVATDLTTNRCFAVIDDTLWELFKDGTTTSRGTFTNGVNSTLPVYFTVNTNNQLGIFDGGSCADYLDSYTIVTNNGNLIGNTFNLSTNTLSTISDVDFPNEAADRGRVYFSNSNDTTAWAAADVFTPTFKADSCIRVIAFREELYCFGKETMEIYLNDGTTPFTRREGTSLLYGLVASHSVAQHANGIIFLGRSNRGQPAVYELTHDYKVQQISPHSVSWQIGKNVHLEDCIGYIQENKEGHIFYYLHIPGADTTLVYDNINNEWHERKSTKPYSLTDGTTEQGMFRGNCYVNWDGLHLFGDRYSGNIFVEDYDVFTEDSLMIARRRDGIIYTQEYRPLSIDRVEIDINSGAGATTGQGNDPQLMFQVSKDKGMTYGNKRFIPLGALGDYSKRVRIHGLGIAEHWGFRFELTDPIACVIVGATANGSFGAV